MTEMNATAVLSADPAVLLTVGDEPRSTVSVTRVTDAPLADWLTVALYAVFATIERSQYVTLDVACKHGTWVTIANTTPGGNLFGVSELLAKIDAAKEKLTTPPENYVLSVVTSAGGFQFHRSAVYIAILPAA